MTPIRTPEIRDRGLRRLFSLFAKQIEKEIDARVTSSTTSIIDSGGGGGSTVSTTNYARSMLLMGG